MTDVQLDIKNLDGFIDKKEWEQVLPKLQQAHEDLHQKKGLGHDFTGWLDLPSRTSDDLIEELMRLGEDVRSSSDILVSAGIGGSYLGIRSTLEFLIADQQIPLYYAGNNLSSGSLHFLLKELEDKRVTLVVISKSGTTTETALAFRVLKEFMRKQYDASDLKKRIICVTDGKKGALRQIADQEGYRTYPIYDDVGGRFSVLSPAGLVSLALAGIDIQKLINGARYAEKRFSTLALDQNIAYRYAAARYLLYRQGKKIEVLSPFYQRLVYLAEWWKQLFGESEGKDGQGLFPAAINLTADLHSMGQLMQEGERNLFETFLMVQNSGYSMIIPSLDEDLDNFNCVAGKDLDFVNKQAHQATATAHFEGGVPNMTITIPSFDAEALGQLYYFFEKAVAVMGYLMGVNPFNQPGVEAYKSKMFTFLGRK
jgi:glucose-6-phosphate isomerase